GLKSRSQSTGLMFVTHNLSVVAEIAQRVCVMYAGQIVEEGSVSEVFARPRHPYTAALIASVPEAGTGRLVAIPGTVPQPSSLARGCCFAPRCPRSGPECTADSPVLERISSGRATRCIKWRELA